MTRATCLLLFSVLLGIPFAQANAADKPNLLIILADDMGFGDLQFTGSKHLKTPHLDQLAASGVFCSQGYVTSPVCSPSRAGLLTGRDPRRFGYEGNLNKSADRYPTRPELLGLPPGEHTLGDHFRSAGYATALIGKWHLGIGEGFHPNERGFDHFCGMLNGSHDYFPTRLENHRIEKNGEAVAEFSEEYLTDYFTDEGLDWMEQQTTADKPWFLFMSYNAPHTPMQARDDDLAKFQHIKNKKRRTYAAMMFALDRGVGRITSWLKDKGELENTLIVFFSDNGGATNNGSWNGPLSGAKGCLKEGGVRTPMIWSWPESLPKGQRYDSPASALDVLPTFLAAAGAPPLPLVKARPYEDPRNRTRSVKAYNAYDGINLLPQLKGESPPANRTLFWRLQGQAAILDGDDKLIRLSHRAAQLFKPSTDAGEKTDLAPEGGERFEALFRQLGEWESMRCTVPLWDSSPFWHRDSAKIYDQWTAKAEPE
ncbi:sulfatase-like hydrolase/transferase [Haloferula sp.]|uniref:sulfatase-like hydrolase/transferase n=1 Tax=Haloferula sp. TaxID=2497595 RepID=UPI00329D5FE5